MNDHLRLVTTLMFAAVTACAPTNPDSLRQEPGKAHPFETTTDYRAIYDREVRGFLRCMTGSYYRMSFAIEPRIDPNTKSATITLVHYGAWKDIWAVVDIRETATGTQVNAYTTNHPLMSDFGIIAEKWANGSQECQTYPITTHQFPNVE